MMFRSCTIKKKRGDDVGQRSIRSNLQLTYLKTRLNMFLEVLEALDPETAELEDIDRLIQMIDDLEMKYERFKKIGKKSLSDFFMFKKEV